MDALVPLALVLPFVTAVTCLLAARSLRAQRAISLAGATAHLAVGISLLLRVRANGIIAYHVGDWDAPIGITLVADHLGALMVVLTGITGLATVAYAFADVDVRRESFAYHALVHVLLAGVTGAFLTGDLFNLFVWFEVLLIASFVLVVLGSSRDQLEGGVKYVVLNAIASLLFLSAVGLLYGLTGTLNMAHLAVRLQDVDAPHLVTAIASLFLVAFGLKAGLFPLFAWLPPAYHTPPTAVSALFAGLLTKVGVYALLRTFTLLFTQDVAFTHGLLLAVAGVTMVTGVLGAAALADFRRILSFHIVSQIGYMIMGLALFTPLAIAGAVFYVGHHIIVKTNLFLVSGIARHVHGSDALADQGGLFRARPLLAFLFLVPALSLAGIPPFSGFWAKLALVKAGLDAGEWGIVGVALVVSLLTLYSMTKIWQETFWKKPQTAPRPVTDTPRGQRLAFMLPVILLALITVAIGLAPAFLFDIASAAAEELLDPSIYIRAVLGEVPA